jgi:hypothetical protein
MNPDYKTTVVLSTDDFVSVLKHPHSRGQSPSYVTFWMIIVMSLKT